MDRMPSLRAPTRSKKSSKVMQCRRIPPVDYCPEVKARSNKIARIIFEAVSNKTVEAYMSDLRRFARWLGELPEDAPYASIWPVLDGLLDMDGMDGNNTIIEFVRNEEQEHGLKDVTLARRVASLRSFVNGANSLGQASWTCMVKIRKFESLKQPTPPKEQVIDLLKNACSQSSPEASVRDGIIVRLLYDLALRRSEVAALRVQDVYRSSHDKHMYINVLGKGAHSLTPVMLPEATAQAMERWYALRVRMPEFIVDNALFVGFKGGKNTGRTRAKLNPASINRIIDKLSNGTITPHALRRASATHALEAGMDYGQVCFHTRHKEPRTLKGYYDNREAIRTASETAEHIALPCGV